MRCGRSLTSTTPWSPRSEERRVGKECRYWRDWSSDVCSSDLGKSPSTTGAGSEGALTKSPFNALRPIVDLNNALISYVLTGMAGFSSCAGHIGPRVRVDHDISLLIPELWCRLAPKERDPRNLIAAGHLERLT